MMCERLQEEINRWKGTPYQSNGTECQRGVDCRYFVLRVLDAMHGITDPLPQRKAPHLSFDDTPAIMSAVNEIRSRYPNERIDVADVETGDIIIFRRRRSAGESRTPAHVGIVVGKVIWHAENKTGVCMSSLAFNRKNAVMAWRPTEKASW